MPVLRGADAVSPRAGGGAAYSGPVRHVYLHVPFCRARCDYCDFASTPVGDAPDDGELDLFVRALAAEWELERPAHDVGRVHTLYLGGGTPSLLGPARLERLLELFLPALTPHAEVTVEANPEDVSAAFARWAARRGVRVSLGVQSLTPAVREALGRRAVAEPAAAYRRLREAGVANLSVDLIQGVPGQTPDDVGRDLAWVEAARPDHVSWYELDVVAGTPLATRLARLPERERRQPDDGVTYRRVVRALSRAGYDWYEVSNFALAGRRARHNAAYWRARPYLGLGPGAVSTVEASRWRDAPDAAAWARALARAVRPPREHEALDGATRQRERLMLAARCGLAVPVAEVARILDCEAASGLAEAGLVSLHSGTIRVTRKGRHVANEVCVRLFRDTHLRRE